MGKRIYRQDCPQPETEFVDAPEGMSPSQFARNIALVEAEADMPWSKQIRQDGWTVFSTERTDAEWAAVCEAVRRLEKRV